MEMQELKKWYGKVKFGEDNFYRLMQNRVREILLVATFYDAFIFEQDGRLSEQIYNEYRQLQLSTAPRITSVPTGKQALEMLNIRQFDLVIIMMRTGDVGPFELSREAKMLYPELPVLLLLNVQSDIEIIQRYPERLQYIDDVFLWNGDTSIFLAMIKSVEDKLNIEHDTKQGLIRVILLVEDSILYYSRFLPLLYKLILRQTGRLIEDELSDIDKRLRMRARPKVILSHTYEDAEKMVEKYHDNLVAVISDVRYPRNGILDGNSGFDLIRLVKNDPFDIPVIMQSSEPENEVIAKQLGADFLSKNSPTLLDDLQHITIRDLGYGDFIFRNQHGHEIGRASNIVEFEKRLQEVPDETLVYHGMRNHFSAWLIAHGDIDLARQIQPIKVGDFSDRQRMRDYLRDIFHVARTYRDRGKIVPFAPYKIDDKDQILRLADGSLGGKGRGLAFMNAILAVTDISSKYENLDIRLPLTMIIGTSEFDRLVEQAEIEDSMHEEEIRCSIINSELSPELMDNLRSIVENIDEPLAVRSSGLLEDSQAIPVAGIYKTCMIPNSHPDRDIRLKQLVSAIKQVFSSVFTATTHKYLHSLHYRFEEEKMAIIIQKVAGQNHGSYFYPALTGFIQSWNRTLCTTQRNADGIVACVAGLSSDDDRTAPHFFFVPEKTDRQIDCREFPCNRFQAIDRSPNNLSAESSEIRMMELDCDLYAYKQRLNCIEKDGKPYLNAQSFIEQNNIANALSDILKLGKKALGMHTEIEFAVDIPNDPNRKNVLYILQIRPMPIFNEESPIDVETLQESDIIISTPNSVGNGIYTPVRDIVYLPEDQIDNVREEDLKELNQALDEDYILIIPSSWSSRFDRKLPLLQWVDIDRVRLIVEIAPRPIEAPRNRHFIHNLIAMNAGFATVSSDQSNTVFKENLIRVSPMVRRFGAFELHRFIDPLAIILDGRHGSLTVCKFHPESVGASKS